MPPKTQRTRKGQRTWELYIRRLLKQVHPDKHLTRNALEQINGVVNVLARSLSETARKLCVRNKALTVKSTDIQAATQLHLRGELSKHAVSQLNKALTKFNSTGGSGPPSYNMVKISSTNTREFAAGLVFSVSFAEKFIREFGASKLRVGQGAPVALATVLEYLVAEIIELAGNAASDARRSGITVRNLMFAVADDEELTAMFNDFGIEFMGGGVLPNIHAALIPTKEQKAKHAAARRRNASGKTGTRKNLPGTKALRLIRKYQQTDDLLLQKGPFERIVRNMASNVATDLHFGGGSILALQYYAEQTTVNVLKSAQELALHANRDGVNGTDISLAFKMMHNLKLVDNVFGSTTYVANTLLEVSSNNGINRLAYRAGIKRRGPEMHEKTKSVIGMLLDNIIPHAVKLTEHHRAKTVSIRDIQDALHAKGVNLTIPDMIKTPVRSRSTGAQGKEEETEESDYEDDE